MPYLLGFLLCSISLLVPSTWYSTWLLMLSPMLEKEPLLWTCHPQTHRRQCYSQPINGIYHIYSNTIGQRKSHGRTPYQWDKEEYPLMGGNCRVKMYNLLTRKGEQIIGEIIKSTTLVKNRIIWGIHFFSLDIDKARKLINELKIPTKTSIRRKRKNRLCVWFPFPLQCFFTPSLVIYKV